MSARGPIRNVKARFFMKVRVSPDDACWEWLAGLNTHGYGKFRLGRSSIQAHRVAYRLLVGEIPDGMHLDHECHNADTECNAGRQCPHRACVNPAHLTPKPPRDNILAGRTPSSLNAVKTHCPQGHAYDELNTGHTGGRRICRACHRDRWRARVATEVLS